MKYIYCIIFILIPSFLISKNDLEISREFGLFTSKNLSEYIKPLTTSISQSLNSSLFSEVDYNNGWSLGFDISVSGMYIPSSQKSYVAELPKLFGDTNVVLTALSKNGKLKYNPSGNVMEPTLYGGKSLPVFASPQNAFPPDSFYKSVAFAEGNNITGMSGLPVIQLIAGLPTRTQLRIRFFTFSLLQSPLTYYTIAINQNIDKFFNFFEINSQYSLGINLTYHSIKRNPGININSFAIGPVFSRNFNSWFSYFISANFEDLNGNIRAIRNTEGNTDVVNSPYEEVRRGDPLNISIASSSKFRLQAGTKLKYKFVDFHLEAALISQPMVSIGASFWIFNTGEKIEINEPIIIPEQVEPLPEITSIFSSPKVEFSTNKISKQQIPIKSNFKILNKDSSEEVKQIVIETFRSRQFRPFLPFIFFDENQAVIPERYVSFNEKQVADYSLNEFKGMNSLDTYYYLLNILGKRMSEIKNSKITLIGCNSNLNKEKNNLKLSLSRAEAVKQYLIEVWKIDKTRIKTIARNLPEKASNISDPDGIAENRRVEIISDSWDITSPVIIEDTLRFIRPGGILIKNDVYSQIPIQNWEFNISSKNEEILKFSGSGNPDESLEIDFTKRDIFKSKLGNEISAYLKVMNEDETGISDIKKLPIEIITKDSSINVYNMILFDFNKADLSKQNQKIADYINNDLQDKADVKIIGFTDRIGEEEYNRKLSEERARATASSLKTKNIEIEGIGEKELLFDNTTPEGRFYSRTVEVQIRQETKEEKPNGK